MAERLTDEQKRLAAVIDHTLLKADATPEQVRSLCSEARMYGFASVCVNPCYVPLAARLLEGSGVRVSTVAGFPLGANTRLVKAYEAQRAILDGAREIDMVLNIGALKAGDLDAVEEDIRAVVEVCHATGALLKVILETGFLTDAEKIEACRRAVSAGADFVKTSTGFGPGGATAADVALMRATVGPQIGVKAAGGIRTYAAAREMLDAGADRLGTSASIQILQGMV
ncbi:MAG: deoxyribose-phosphate aldolase [Anaerolineae bacterium]|nr:deoxyribose-phosphate aldolase [Anaerolineae bacterium]